MTGPGTPGDVDAAVVEKAAHAVCESIHQPTWADGIPCWACTTLSRAALAAVLPDVRAQARREVAEEIAGVCAELRAMLVAADEWTKGYVRALEQVEADAARIARAAADPEGPS